MSLASYILLANIMLAQESAENIGADDNNAEMQDTFSPLAGPQVFFDAQSSRFSRDGTKQIFMGNVIAITADTFVGADKIEVDRTKSLISAEGNIIVLTSDQVFLGSSMQYNIANDDIEIQDAVLTTNDSSKVTEIKRDILGFSDEELKFEAAVKERLSEIETEKIDLKKKFRQEHHTANEQQIQNMIDQYTLLLEREKLIRTQENKVLLAMPDDLRNSYKRRRTFIEAKRKENFKIAKGSLETTYFKLKGGRITRVNKNDIAAEQAFMTTCKCDDDENPAWGFRASNIEAQVGGYADLTHPVLEVKGIPVLYLPYLRLPLKNKNQRQSGFLLPVFNYEKKSGTIYSQPVFFAFSDSTDATAKIDWIERRGTRLGMEYRRQIRNYSGWTLQLEGLRDRLWVDEMTARRDLIDIYSDGLTEARKVYSGQSEQDNSADNEIGKPAWWEQDGIKNDKLFGTCLLSEEDEKYCQVGLKKKMGAPLNDWRGRFFWQGGHFFAPRLSLVSEGELLSDHRYADELYFAESLQDVLSEQERAQSFSKIKWFSHLDTRNLYLGMGSSFGDHMYLDGRFSGQQIPIGFKAHSKYISIFPKNFPVVTYGQAHFDGYKIEDNQSLEEEGLNSSIAKENSLSNGYWQRARLRFLTPLVTQQVITMNHFADFENRWIHHSGLKTKSSRIQSWRTGLKFDLPLDGSMKLPKWFQDKALMPGELAKESYLKHEMNWGVMLSLRPVVVREGLYGNVYDLLGENGQALPNSKSLTYFASDQKVLPEDHEFALPEDAMIPEKKVIFTTNHSWSFFDRGWNLLPAKTKSNGSLTSGSNSNVQEDSQGKGVGIDEKNEQKVSLHEIARDELLYSLDRPVSSSGDMFGDDKWFINRYRVVDSGEFRPLSFSGEISYDFFLEELRKEQKPLFEEKVRHNEDVDKIADNVLDTDPDNPEVQKEATEIRKKQKVKVDPLPQPWSTLKSNLLFRVSNWSLSGSVNYNLYEKKATKVISSLTLPVVWNTGVSFAFQIDNSSGLDSYGEFTDSIEKTRSVSIVTRPIKRITLSTIMADKTSANQTLSSQKNNRYFSDNYQTAIGMSYLDRSECWGLSFSRIKKYETDERQATYLIQLVVNFAGQTRSLPNMSPGIISSLPVGESQE